MDIDNVGNITGVTFLDTLDYGNPPGDIHAISGYDSIASLDAQPNTPHFQFDHTVG
jgi:hypothetical protein